MRSDGQLEGGSDLDQRSSFLTDDLENQPEQQDISLDLSVHGQNLDPYSGEENFRNSLASQKEHPQMGTIEERENSQLHRSKNRTILFQSSPPTDESREEYHGLTRELDDEPRNMNSSRQQKMKKKSHNQPTYIELLQSEVIKGKDATIKLLESELAAATEKKEAEERKRRVVEKDLAAAIQKIEEEECKRKLVENELTAANSSFQLLQYDLKEKEKFLENIQKDLNYQAGRTCELHQESDRLKEEMSQLSATLKEKDQQLLDHKELMQAKDLESQDTISQLKQELDTISKQLEDTKRNFDQSQEKSRLAFTKREEETSAEYAKLHEWSNQEIENLKAKLDAERQDNQVLPRDSRTPSATWRPELAISRPALRKRPRFATICKRAPIL